MAAGLTKHFMKRVCLLFQAIEKVASTALQWEWVFTSEVDGRYVGLHVCLVFFLLNSSRFSPTYFTYFYSRCHRSIAFLRDPWASTYKHNTNCDRISPFTSTEVNPSFIHVGCRYIQTPAFVEHQLTKTVASRSLDNNFALKLPTTLPQNINAM